MRLGMGLPRVKGLKAGSYSIEGCTEGPVEIRDDPPRLPELGSLPDAHGEKSISQVHDAMRVQILLPYGFVESLPLVKELAEHPWLFQNSHGVKLENQHRTSRFVRRVE